MFIRIKIFWLSMSVLLLVPADTVFSLATTRGGVASTATAWHKRPDGSQRAAPLILADARG